MSFQDRNDKLLDWLSRRLFPEKSPAEETARLDKLLSAVPTTPFTEAELTRILRKSRSELPLHAEKTTPHQNGKYSGPKLLRFPLPALRSLPLRVAAFAAAACLLMAVGWYFLGSPTSTSNLDGERLYVKQPFKFAGGQGILRLTGTGGKVTLLDFEKGQVRLDQGGVYLEMEGQGGNEAEVETPLGTVAAGDTRCYIRRLEKSPKTGKETLAVLVLDGQVQVSNGQGMEMAEAGELIIVETGLAPERAFPTAFAAEDQDWSLAQEVLQLLGDLDIQDQLQLIPPQLDQLILPAPEELKRAESLLLSLPLLSFGERKKNAGEFFARQADHLVSILDLGQKKQFEKIRVRLAGFGALVRKDISQILKLDNQQQEKIRTQLFSFNAAKQALFVHGVETSLKLGKALVELEQKQASKILSLLKPPQQQQWKEITGHPNFGPPAGIFGIGKNGFNINLFGSQAKSEEQLWESWLLKTAKQVKMLSTQFNQASQLLQKAKKEAAAYRQTKQFDFKQLFTEKSNLFKSKKFDKQAQQALDQKAEVLHLNIARIGQEWKEDVLELLTPLQMKTLVQIGQKEMPQGLGVPGFWDKPPPPKKGGPPGWDKKH